MLFTTGHGERSLDSQEADGLAGIQEILGADNFEVEEWSSLGKTSIPPGTDLVVVAGPTSPFLELRAGALAAYLNGGGRMLVLVDPTLGPAEGYRRHAHRLRDLARRVRRAARLRHRGRSAQHRSPATPPATLFANEYGSHPITNALSQSKLPVLVNVARSVGRAEGRGRGSRSRSCSAPPTKAGARPTSPRSARSTGARATSSGPVSLGVAVEGERNGKKMRLVVFGDSDFATNQLVQANQPTRILLSNALNWLVEREALLTIPPKKTEQVRLNLTEEQSWTVYGLSLLLLLPWRPSPASWSGRGGGGGHEAAHAAHPAGAGARSRRLHLVL